VAAVAQRLSQAIPRARRQVEPVSTGRGAAGRAGWPRHHRGGASGGGQRRAPIPAARTIARVERHRAGAGARADGPQHSACTHACRFGGARERRRPRARSDTSRSDGRRRCRVRERHAQRSDAGSGRSDRHVGHRADSPGNGLWLHPGRDAGQSVARRGLRRKTRPAHGRALPARRRLPVERWHLCSQGLGVDGCTRALPARHRGGNTRGMAGTHARRGVRAAGPCSV
jgi:hypothetical protein